MDNRFVKISLFLLSILLSSVFGFQQKVYAGYQKIAPGDTITLGEFVYDDNFVATTTDCTVGINNPSNVEMVASTTLMTANSDGWHYYNYTTAGNAVSGTWPSIIICGTAARGDLVIVDKSFIVDWSIVSTSTVKEVVDDSLTVATSSLAAVINTHTDVVSNTASTSIVSQISSFFAAIPASVWGGATRTLTSAILGDGGRLATESYVDTATSTLTNTIEVASTSLAVNINANTDLQIQTASSSVVSQVLSSITSIPANVWSYVGGAGRSLTTAFFGSGSLATQSDVITATSSLASAITAGTGAVNSNTDAQLLAASTSLAAFINNNSNVTILAASTSLASYLSAHTTAASSSIASFVNANTNSTVLAASTSLAAFINANTDAQTAGIASAVNANTNLASSSLAAAISTASSSVVSQILASITSIPANVWSYGGRTLDSFGTLVADVWTNGTRTLTGANLNSGSLATQADVTTASSSLASIILAVKSNTDNIDWSDITAIKNNVDTLITEVGTGNISAIKTSTDSIDWADVTGLVVTGGDIKAKTDTIAWANVTDIKTKTDTIAWADVTGIKTKTDTILWTDISSLASQIDMASTSLATAISDISITSGVWSTALSNTNEVEPGYTYRAKVQITSSGESANPASAPLVSLYDPSRNLIVSGIAMTNLATGIYEYTYSVPLGAAQGSWETVVDLELQSGKNTQVNDFWKVTGSPAQIIINNITDNIIPSIGANLTITNEGLSGYEYQYEWCVVSNISDTCGGGDDIYHATAAKYINPGEDFNTTLTATVPTAGNYYFKALVHFGTDSSGASRSFTAIAETDGGGTVGGGGGGGGGGAPTITEKACNGADFNADKKANSVDFSILLAFWQKLPPFKNPCVDINKDNKVNSVDFSILLYQWKK